MMKQPTRDELERTLADYRRNELRQAMDINHLKLAAARVDVRALELELIVQELAAAEDVPSLEVAREKAVAWLRE